MNIPFHWKSEVFHCLPVQSPIYNQQANYHSAAKEETEVGDFKYHEETM